MDVHHKELRRLLINSHTKKAVLSVKASISPAAITKTDKAGYVTAEVQLKFVQYANTASRIS